MSETGHFEKPKALSVVDQEIEITARNIDAWKSTQKDKVLVEYIENILGRARPEESGISHEEVVLLQNANDIGAGILAPKRDGWWRREVGPGGKIQVREIPENT